MNGNDERSLFTVLRILYDDLRLFVALNDRHIECMTVCGARKRDTLTVTLCRYLLNVRKICVVDVVVVNFATARLGQIRRTQIQLCPYNHSETASARSLSRIAVFARRNAVTRKNYLVDNTNGRNRIIVCGIAQIGRAVFVARIEPEADLIYLASALPADRRIIGRIEIL